MATERTVVLIRHGKSDWSGDEADIDRPLAARGRRQARESGRWLAAHTEPIELAVVSPARRAQGTWEVVAAELRHPPPVRIDERVYAAAGRTLAAVVRGLPEGLATVALVGHNPAVEQLAAILTGEWVAMPTSTVAVITWPGPWSAAGESSAVLRASGRPPQE